MRPWARADRFDWSIAARDSDCPPRVEQEVLAQFARVHPPVEGRAGEDRMRVASDIGPPPAARRSAEMQAFYSALRWQGGAIGPNLGAGLAGRRHRGRHGVVEWGCRPGDQPTSDRGAWGGNGLAGQASPS